MATISDTQRTPNAYTRQGYGYAGAPISYASQYGNRNMSGTNYGMHPSSNDMAALAHTFQGMNLPSNSYVQANHSMAQATGGRYASMPVTGMQSMYGSTAGYAYPNSYSTATAHNAAAYSPHGTHYMPHYQGYQTHDNSPLSQNWTPTTAAGADIPSLVTPRRDSVSSTENDQPATPSYANYANLHGGVAINRSPSGLFTHSTPSPTSMIGPYGIHVAKQPEQSDISPRLKLLVAQDPPIPRAIPAPSSPLKPLDRALENQRGETNVYIRGLLPETTDDMLETWGSRFGDIKSSKSIIDMPTGLCKGFGFVKYHNYEDAENCIRGFHYLGYEVSFARESFYSKLKTFADEGNTNLYVSNLPKSMNEHELANLFEPHKVCSARILRDKNGHGRGVGFARFENRDACEEVIATFNNHSIQNGPEELQIQIRYADTQDQKSLKQQTQAARQFRSAEYEYATQAWRHDRLSFSALPAPDKDKSQASGNEFEQYIGQNVGGNNLHASRWSNTAGRVLPGRSPLGATPYTTTPSGQNSTHANATKNRTGAVSKPEVEQLSTPVDSGRGSSPTGTASTIKHDQ